MSPLSPVVDTDNWGEEILEDAREFFNGRIEVLDPSNIIETPFDPDTDEGGDSSLEIVLTNDPDDPVRGRPARIQHLRLPLENAGSGEWATKRRYRMQVEILPGDPVLQKGQIVNVLDGGKDPSLEAFSYTLVSAANSSHAALRTLETVTEGADDGES